MQESFSGRSQKNRHFGAELQHNPTFDRSPADDLVLNCISLIVIMLFRFMLETVNEQIKKISCVRPKKPLFCAESAKLMKEEVNLSS